MIISPIQQMEHIKEQPVFWKSWIILCFLAGTALGWSGLYEVNHPQFSESILQSFPADMQSQVNVEQIQMNTLSLIIFSGFLGGVLVPLAGGMVMWLFSRILRGVGTFKQFLSFHVHLFSIYVLSFLVQAILVMIMDQPLAVSPFSLAMILPVEGTLEVVLSTLDLFTIWIAILLGIGMREIAQLSNWKSWLITVFYLLLLVLISLYSLG